MLFYTCASKHLLCSTKNGIKLCKKHKGKACMQCTHRVIFRGIQYNAESVTCEIMLTQHHASPYTSLEEEPNSSFSLLSFSTSSFMEESSARLDDIFSLSVTNWTFSSCALIFELNTRTSWWIPHPPEVSYIFWRDV